MYPLLFLTIAISSTIFSHRRIFFNFLFKLKFVIIRKKYEISCDQKRSRNPVFHCWAALVVLEKLFEV